MTRKRAAMLKRFSKNATAQPTEDSALFNPLVHGNRRFGRKFAGRPFTTATKYKGPSGKR